MGPPDCWARLPTPSLYQKANPEEEAKFLSLSFSFSLLDVLLRPALSTSTHLASLAQPILILLLIPPPPSLATPPSPPPPSLTRLTPFPFCAPSSRRSLSLRLGLPYTYCLWWAPGPAPTQGVLLLSDIIYNSEAGRKPT